MTRRVRLWWWLHVMDVLAACERVCGRLYLAAVKRASDSTDWDEVPR